jgi:hypothetical protein
MEVKQAFAPTGTVAAVNVKLGASDKKELRQHSLL